MTVKRLACFLCLLLVLPCALAQEEQPDVAAEAEADAEPRKAKKKDESKIKPYDEVITEKAKSKQGLFSTHLVGDKLYYEIPSDQLGREMVWVVQVAETTAGNSYAGMPAGDRVVRWEKRGDRVLLRDVRYRIRADDDDAIALAVQSSNLAPIIRAFDVKAYAESGAPVIDVTDLFTKGVPEISARRTLSAGEMDSKRTFVDSVKSFPTNVEVRVLASYKPMRTNAAARSGGRPSPRSNIPTSSGLTARIHHSMVQLPAEPMEPRRWDERVGFFAVGFTDYGDDSWHQAERVRYITRWRLEKKEPGAALSEPVKPIVFYVAREVPDKWKPYVKAGIDQWQPAFEAAGFKNAIVGKYAPTPEQDPDWDPEDARISSIRWLPASVKNAFGPHVHDPRTGEILEADVRMYHDVQKLVRDWYFVQAAATDPRVQQLPMPDDLVGELIQFVVAHEVGHSLGFPHNMKASSSYSIAQLRDGDWTRKNGTAPSIMDYARFNYVAQPGDDAGLLPQIGPYDHFATEWGYRQFPDGADQDRELARIVARQIDEPMFRFGNADPRSDSTRQTEDLGDDAVEATRLGLANLERIAAMLVDATSAEGEDYEVLDNMYGELLGQWRREMAHVVSVVGGVEQNNLFYGDAEARFAPNPPEYQRRAVSFLLDSALTTPGPFIADEIVLRLTDEGVAERVLATQRRLLASLVSPARIDRMAEIADGDTEAYTPTELLTDVRRGLFRETQGMSGAADIYRRNLQRAYVEQLGGYLLSPDAGSDLPGLARQELAAIAELAERTSSRLAATERVHRADLAARIERALDPRAAVVSARNAAAITDADLDALHEVPQGEHDCRF